MKKFKFILFFSLIIFAITIILSFTSIYKNIELKWIDTNFTMRGEKPISDDVVIVAIGDQDFQELGQWPFPRSYYAKLIENLNKAGAKIIAFDIEFTEPTVPEQDDVFAEAAAKYDNIILAGKLVMQTNENAKNMRILKPLKVFTKRNIDWGLVGISQDDDSFVRQSTLFSKFDNKVYYSLGVKVLQKLLALKYNDQPNMTNSFDKFGIGHFLFSKYKSNTAFINYYGPANTFPYYSMDSVVDDSSFTVNSEKDLGGEQINSFDYYLNDQTFKDKIVLVGLIAEELHDIFPTPFYNFEREKKLTPGVEIHANFLEMILHKNSINQFSVLYFLIILLILSFAVNSIYTFFKPGINAGLSILLIIAYGYLVYYLFAQKNLILNITEIPSMIILAFLGNLVRQYYLEQKQKKFIKQAFTHYLSPQVIDKILKDPSQLKLGGERKELTIFFSDVQGFTGISEHLNPRKLTNLLNDYLSDMTDIILEEEGTLDKYEGDAIIAFWNAPLDLFDHPIRCCSAALRCSRKLEERQAEFEKISGSVFKARIGIHTGEVVVGNMGSKKRFDYTMLGDAVNLASRLEGANKAFGTYFMVSEVTWERVSNNFIGREIGKISVVGRKAPITVFEPLGFADETLDEIYLYYNEGIEYCKQKNWKKALQSFKKCKDDPVAAVYRKKCEELLGAVNTDWDGVWNLTSK
ncbi:MAG: adenylate/guanylate cyclase domain-containing protein [Candidatus Cloacimonadota bacterium]|nr:adenylate/guanylate cyclase domain-containing protein [Candidatus Cloacimonadota bacterium]